MNQASEFLLHHSSHDVGKLYARWETIAAETGLEEFAIGRDADFEVRAWKSTETPTEADGIYLSAGVHGDEAAPPLALASWAEANLGLLKETPCAIVPCFNPWGLSENIRRNSKGEDLNRLFGNSDHPLLGSWRQFMGEAKFQFGICLHEDYDAGGIYLYELGRLGENPGEACLRACENIIPREPNVEIEGRESESALIQKVDGFEEWVDEFEEDGLPEAIYLHMNYSRHSLTFETPSEYSLHARVQAHVRFLETVIAAQPKS